jgi:signal transduction histidine kinase
MPKESSILVPWIILGMTMLILIFVLFIIVVTIEYQKKQMKYTLEIEQAKSLFEKEIMESKIDMQVQTFKEVAQEIHDNLGQKLSMAKLYLSTSETSRIINEERIRSTSALLSEVMNDMRAIVQTLDPDFILNVGLLEGIHRTVNQIEKSETMSVSFKTSGPVRSFEERHEFVIFRIFQEAVNNVIKHAHAKNIQIEVVFESAELKLIVQDDGIGFKETIEEMNCGMGLENMKRRARLLQGTIKFLSLGRGTRMELKIPQSPSPIFVG